MLQSYIRVHVLKCYSGKIRVFFEIEKILKILKKYSDVNIFYSDVVQIGVNSDVKKKYSDVGS